MNNSFSFPADYTGYYYAVIGRNTYRVWYNKNNVLQEHYYEFFS